MNNKNILFLVEGERTDYKLMEEVLELFDINDEYNIVPFKTNLYVLYDKLFIGDDSNVDLLLTLRSYSTTSCCEEIFNFNYSHIILCFDLDPHDSQYSKEKIDKLTAFFNESTDNGKLYINYPMIESFGHRISSVDDDYKDLVIKYDRIRSYKKIVGSVNKNPKALRKSVEDTSKIIYDNLCKSHFICGNEFGYYVDSNQLAKRQAAILEEKTIVYVICTCIFFILDYNKNLLLKNLTQDYLSRMNIHYGFLKY